MYFIFFESVMWHNMYHAVLLSKSRLGELMAFQDNGGWYPDIAIDMCGGLTDSMHKDLDDSDHPTIEAMLDEGYAKAQAFAARARELCLEDLRLA